MPNPDTVGSGRAVATKRPMIARIWHGWTKTEDAKAYEKLLRDEICRLGRQWEILCDFDDDLNNPKFAVALWRDRYFINPFVEQVYAR